MAGENNLRQGWASAALRMQQVACNNNANAVITISILIDRSGNPVFWMEPNIHKVEPAARFEEVMQELIMAKGRL